MQKIIITILGQDRPGIIAAVTQSLYEFDANVENISQTILQSEFAGIFILSLPDAVSADTVAETLNADLNPLHLHAHVKQLDPDMLPAAAPPTEPFIVAASGPDNKGLVAAVTRVFADFKINVKNLQAVFKGGENPNANSMVYELEIPTNIDYGIFSRTLKETGKTLGLEISIQHKNIFDRVTRI
ncbi:MAG: amino acid-binding protein [Deltaproteobacteria bacterium]|nr:MAG: amino acid-binding protein [Deltaproteobacteria bacterium]